jgi:hypothetical protein
MRKDKLVDLNPKWMEGRYAGADGAICGVRFDCPEGHADCWHAIPFTPDLAGVARESWQTNGAVWQRVGDTFETLSLSPSILRVPQFVSREAAIAAGCIPEYITDSTTCAFHGFVTNGAITFCGDSK